MGIRCNISLISRKVIVQRFGGGEQLFLGSAEGTNRVFAQIFVNETPGDSAAANVNKNGRFRIELGVPAGLPPAYEITIRVRSVGVPSCQIQQTVDSVPLVD